MKKRVLYFVDRMGRGGIQTLLYNIVSYFDKQKIQVDFLLLDDGKKYDIEDKLISSGYNVFKLQGVWVKKITDFLKLNKALDNFFKEHHNYDIVHLHSTSKNYMVLKIAKKYGINMRISHSHSTGFQSRNILKIIYGTFLKSKLIKYSTDFYACSYEAGKWLFGKKIIESNKFKIIKNGIDCERFKFDPNIRENMRKKLNISKETKVIGHIGRFTKVKNHMFLLNVYKEYEKLNTNSKLLLVGKGPLENKIKKLVKKNNLENKVIFAGIRENTNDFLQAMDCFVFPSLKEGLGIALIEAQANGLKCYTSKNVVPKEANVTNSVSYISLNDSAKEWAKKILENNNERKDYLKLIKSNDYNIIDSAIILEKLYIECDKN